MLRRLIKTAGDNRVGIIYFVNVVELLRLLKTILAESVFPKNYFSCNRKKYIFAAEKNKTRIVQSFENLKIT